MAKFEVIGDKETPFLAIAQDAINALESITPAEKASAVPFVRIWAVDPDSGDPIHKDSSGNPTGALTNQTNTPPSFGLPSDGETRFRERPPVSLERIHIKTDNPRGIITYRTLELKFTVHRPEVVFEENSEHDSWSSLIIPGKVHVLEYGWTASAGVKNGILNGEGVSQEGGKTVPARTRIKFVVTNYTFRIANDNQIEFTIQAFEDGEYNMRRMTIGVTLPKKEGKDGKLTDAYSADGQKIVKAVQDQIGKDLKDSVSDGRVKLQDLLDKMFADRIKDAYKGYKEVKLFLGKFNKLVPTPVKGYKMSGEDIGNFEIPLKEIQRTFSALITKEAQQLTIYNFLKPFLNIVGNANTWDETKGTKDDKDRPKNVIPQLIMRTITSKNNIAIYIFDVRREFIKFEPGDYKPEEKLSRSETRKKVIDKKIPFVSFGKGNSYIQEANFDVQPDDQIKSLFIQRYAGRDRAAITGNPDIVNKAGKLPIPEKTLYSSAIRGDITMLGNFAFDLFGLVWLDFGVKVWDGPFNVLTREDTIERGSFMTKLTFVAEGSDPLGTQGRRDTIVKQEQADKEKSASKSKKKKRDYGKPKPAGSKA